MRPTLPCIKMHVWGLEDDLVDKLPAVTSTTMWAWIPRAHPEAGIMIPMCNPSTGDGGNQGR